MRERYGLTLEILWIICFQLYFRLSPFRLLQFRGLVRQNVSWCYVDRFFSAAVFP
jgi:hypothetical protein